MAYEIIYTSDDGPVPTFFHELQAIFPCLDTIVVHPETGAPEHLHNVIIELNDDYMWSRTRVADWLETLSMDITRSDTYGYLDNASIRRNEEGTYSD